jgi:hypothetical protein
MRRTRHAPRGQQLARPPGARFGQPRPGLIHRMARRCKRPPTASIAGLWRLEQSLTIPAVVSRIASGVRPMFVTVSSWVRGRRLVQRDASRCSAQRWNAGLARRGTHRRVGCGALVAKSDLTGWKDWLSGGWPGGEAGFFKWLDSGGEDDVPYLEPEKQPRAGKAGGRPQDGIATARADNTGARYGSTPSPATSKGGRVVTKLVTNPITGRITLEYVAEDEENEGRKN